MKPEEKAAEAYADSQSPNDERPNIGNIHSLEIGLRNLWEYERDSFLQGVRWQEERGKVLVEALEFTLGCTRNLLCDPENEGIPIGLDPTFYHTLSYEGDMELRQKYFKAKDALKAYEEGK